MKLEDLNPKWIVQHEYAEWDEATNKNPKRHGMGITFDCPKCKNHRVGVWFLKPLDGFPRAFGIEKFWNNSEESTSFDNLTLTPSLDFNYSKNNCWHGFVTNGKVT